MPGTIRTFQDNRSELIIRKSCWRWWIISITLTTWILWYCSGPTPEAPDRTRFSILWAMLASGLSIPIGWLFGYKLGIQAMFAGFYVFNNK